MNSALKSSILVGLQFIFIILLIRTTHIARPSLLVITIIVSSAILMLWAIVSMQKSKLRIQPQPASNASLVTHGPYLFIRHPMYTALILGSLGLVIHQFSWMRFITWVLFIIVLISKLTWEEKMLALKFEHYNQYRQNTYKLIPFIF